MGEQRHFQALLRRWLKVADATAITTQKALQRDLSYAKKVAQVFRSEILSLEWEETQGGSEGQIKDLAMNTNLMLNPNKHFMELAFNQEVLNPRGNVWVLVAEPGAGENLLKTVNKRHLLPFALNQVHWGTLWELEISDPDPVALAQEMAVTQSRRRGLLGNPHIQDIHVLEHRPRASELVDLMHQHSVRL